MTKPVIEVRNLSKSYVISHQKEVKRASALGDLINTLKKPLGGGGPGYTKETFWALNDISFEVPQGEIFGVIGQNGSGKSTLLKILSRIVDPSKGRVVMRGKVASLLEVGTGFHPELTGRENIFLNGSLLGMSRSEVLRKFNEIVEFSEVERFLDTPVKFYSSGMYVRLAFSVAAHLEPDILILDEVLSVGDAQFQKKSLDKMLSVARDGKTILFVSHSVGAVEELCSKTMWLNKGELMTIGKTRTVLDKYLDFSAPDQNISETSSAHQNGDGDGISGKSVTTFELSDARSRQGNGRVVFERLELINSLTEDKKLKLKVWIKNKSSQSFDNTRLSFSIINPIVGKGAVSTLSNENVAQQITIKPGENVITLTVSNVSLVAGKYSINSYLARDNTNKEIFDWIENSAYFVVPDYDFYGVGKAPVYPGKILNFEYSFNQKGDS